MFRWLGYFGLVKEVARHLLRRPVVGIAVVATTEDGRFLLIRRGDSGDWALPGGTLEWGETLEQAALREMKEEAGVDDIRLGALLGVYSAPERDPRFHAVTVLVSAKVGLPVRPPMNSVEILEVRLFTQDELPKELSHGMTPMLDHARLGKYYWE